MSFVAKTDWQTGDELPASDLNRIEAGVELANDALNYSEVSINMSNLWNSLDQSLQPIETCKFKLKAGIVFINSILINTDPSTAGNSPFLIPEGLRPQEIVNGVSHLQVQDGTGTLALTQFFIQPNGQVVFLTEETQSYGIVFDVSYPL